MSKLGKILHWVGHGIAIALIVVLVLLGRSYVKDIIVLEAELVSRDSSALALDLTLEDFKNERNNSEEVQTAILQDLNKLHNEVTRQKGINRTLKARTLKYERIINPTTVDSILTRYSITSPRDN